MVLALAAHTRTPGRSHGIRQRGPLQLFLSNTVRGVRSAPDNASLGVKRCTDPVIWRKRASSNRAKPEAQRPSSPHERLVIFQRRFPGPIVSDAYSHDDWCSGGGARRTELCDWSESTILKVVIIFSSRDWLFCLNNPLLKVSTL